MSQIQLGLGPRQLPEVVQPKMWNIEAKAIAWEDNSENEEYGSEDLTDSDFESGKDTPNSIESPDKISDAPPSPTSPEKRRCKLKQMKEKVVNNRSKDRIEKIILNNVQIDRNSRRKYN